MDEDVLTHHGVKGMRWGHRKISSLGSGPDPVKEHRKTVLKDRRNLSDQDIQKYVERLNTEKKLKTLIEEDVSPGKTFVKEIMKDSGKKIAKTLVVGGVAFALKLALTKKLNPGGMRDAIINAPSYLAPNPHKK